MPAEPPLLIAIPPGRIELRDARSARSREAALRAFEIGRTPVTAAQYREVGTDGRRSGNGSETGAHPRGALQPGASEPDVPVHPITWFEAVRWCNAASTAAGLEAPYVVEGREVAWNVAAGGFRLPTEAEWEFACRAGSPDPTYGPLADIAWAEADDVDGPQPVARKAPNDFGLFDTLGNVWEWCWDYADTARYGDYRSLRGGGWADREWSVRASVRRGSAPDAVLEDVGFRVARGAVGEAREQAAQGWSADADRRRAAVPGPLPMGWTPLR